MACFLVPAGEAIVTTIVQKIIEKKEKSSDTKLTKMGVSWSRKLGWLNKMLWGGTILLALEHIWHGEVVPWPPFLTAMSNPAEVSPMLHEIATIGVAMAVTISIIWGVMVLVSEFQSRTISETEQAPVVGGK